MLGYPEDPKAWWLTRGMARISGVNLSQAIVEGWLNRAELEAMIARCAACDRRTDCEAWLAASGVKHAIPDFCPNRSAIEALGS